MPSDWRIVLDARDKRAPEPYGTLEVLEGEQDDALSALECWAETFQLYGVIPDSLDFRSRSGVSVVKRVGKAAFLCRADCFEFDTEAGRSNGYCYLRAVEVIEDCF